MRFVALAVGAVLAFLIPAFLEFATLRTVFSCDYSECRPGNDGQMTNITGEAAFSWAGRAGVGRR